MVGHESVDPKPQEKSDLVNGVILVYEIGGERAFARARASLFFIYVLSEALAWLRRKGIRS